MAHNTKRRGLTKRKKASLVDDIYMIHMRLAAIHGEFLHLLLVWMMLLQLLGLAFGPQPGEYKL